MLSTLPVFAWAINDFRVVKNNINKFSKFHKFEASKIVQSITFFSITSFTNYVFYSVCMLIVYRFVIRIRTVVQIGEFVDILGRILRQQYTMVTCFPCRMIFVQKTHSYIFYLQSWNSGLNGKNLFEHQLSEIDYKLVILNQQPHFIYRSRFSTLIAQICVKVQTPYLPWFKRYLKWNDFILTSIIPIEIP